MDVSCFLRNNESLLIKKTDKTTYKSVKNICEQRNCTYDFIVSKFKLSDSPDLDTYFTGCNFKELVLNANQPYQHQNFLII